MDYNIFVANMLVDTTHFEILIIDKNKENIVCRTIRKQKDGEDDMLAYKVVHQDFLKTYYN